MLSVITNSDNKKIKGPTLMELFTATGKLKKFFLQLEMFDVCTTGDTAHIDTIFKFLPHTRQHGCIDILQYCDDQCLKARIVAHRTSVFVKKKIFSFPVAVNNSIMIDILVFLLHMFVITENIMKHPVCT
jgi:hypothetical protein